MGQIGVTPIDANRALLGALGRKMMGGSKLSLSENLMALSASASVTSDYYGPGPDTMGVKTLELPESVKGMLVEYAS